MTLDEAIAEQKRLIEAKDTDTYYIIGLYSIDDYRIFQIPGKAVDNPTTYCGWVELPA